jgi:hypothetical protein
LEEDGLHQDWQQGNRSDWEEQLGENNSNDVEEYAPPFSIQRLNDTEQY